MRVELVAAGAAPLEARHQQVDQAFGLAQLGRRHAIEVAMAQDLALRVRVGRDDDAVDRRLVVAGVIGVGRDRRAALVRAQITPLQAVFGGRAAGLLRLGRGVLAGQRRRRIVIRQARAAPTPPAVEGGVVDRPVVTPADEHRRAGRLDLLAIGDIDEGQRAGEVDRCTEIDRQVRRAQRSPEADRLAQETAAVDLRSERGADDGGVGHGGRASSGGQPPAAASDRYRRVRRRGPGGCPPRT